ncbi:MAG TPA: hypothetical protein V6D25_22230 [Leptolyngbyaceae cyanobacterium]
MTSHLRENLTPKQSQAVYLRRSPAKPTCTYFDLPTLKSKHSNYSYVYVPTK